MSSDEGVIATNNDATNCKRCAVQLGYWKDPYIQFFVRSAERRPPEINRGYYTRTESVKKLVQRFIKVVEPQKCQIVNLGAGYDTLFWRLRDERFCPARFIEIDFPTVTSYKCYCIKNKKPLLQKIASEDDDVRISKCELHSDSYHIVSCDLRNTSQIEMKLKECDLDLTLPTLFISECVLIYISSEDSANLIKWIASKFLNAVFINYEQVNMEDRFGKIMVENLNQRHCTLAGVDVCKNFQTQIERFTYHGWDDASCLDMNMIYHKLPQDQIERIEGIEFMDEKEIFEQLMTHYSITVAHKDSSNLNLKSVMFD